MALRRDIQSEIWAFSNNKLESIPSIARRGAWVSVEDMIERWHIGLHAVAELSPRPPCAIVSDKTRVPAEALRVVAPKQLSHARKLEPTVGAFNEQTHARECSQQTIEPVF
jgi:hypothetical protein